MLFERIAAPEKKQFSRNLRPPTVKSFHFKELRSCGAGPESRNPCAPSRATMQIMCAGQPCANAIGHLSSDTSAARNGARPLGRDAGIAPTTAEEMRKQHGPALWGGLGNTFGHRNMSLRELLDKIALLATPQGSDFDQGHHLKIAVAPHIFLTPPPGSDLGQHGKMLWGEICFQPLLLGAIPPRVP